uniref:G-protein coupled receptors family 1 profile domain-containing protein n=1 Tax=Panagrolaimus sp. JU765 TaxID=591449 RepID=A0AC34PVT2_9BILA
MYLYTIDGFILMFVDIILVSLIYITKGLRNQKEFVIFAGNMIYDAAFGLQYFLAGSRRLMLVYGNEKYLEAYSKWDCLTMLYGFLFVLNTPAPGIMALLCCLDRFLSVTFPLKYIKLPSYYPYLLILMAVIFSSPPVIVTGIMNYQTRTNFTVTSVCSLQETTPEFINLVLRSIRIVTTVPGILMYIFIGYKIFKMMNATKNYTKELSIVKKKRLIMMTLTFSLMTLNEALLFVIPDIIALVDPKTPLKYLLSALNLNR